MKTFLVEDLPTWCRWIFRRRRPIGPNRGWALGRRFQEGGIYYWLNHDGYWNLPPVTPSNFWDQKEVFNQFQQRVHRGEIVVIREWVRKGGRYVQQRPKAMPWVRTRPNRIKRALDWLFGW